MRLSAAFEGKLQEYMKAEFATAERAVTLGVSSRLLDPGSSTVAELSEVLFRA